MKGSLSGLVWRLFKGGKKTRWGLRCWKTHECAVMMLAKYYSYSSPFVLVSRNRPIHRSCINTHVKQYHVLHRFIYWSTKSHLFNLLFSITYLLFCKLSRVQARNNLPTDIWNDYGAIKDRGRRGTAECSFNSNVNIHESGKPRGMSRDICSMELINLPVIN